MHIDKAGLDLAAHRILPQNPIKRRERIVKRPLHKDLPEDLRDQNFPSSGRVEHPRADTGRGLGKIQRAKDARLAVDMGEHIALVERMVAQRDDVGTTVE